MAFIMLGDERRSVALHSILRNSFICLYDIFVNLLENGHSDHCVAPLCTRGRERSLCHSEIEHSRAIEHEQARIVDDEMLKDPCIEDDEQIGSSAQFTALLVGRMDAVPTVNDDIRVVRGSEIK